ncbi:hypothetical protein MNBD_UNCLBAC01-901 [hydrothermal vent metagenome]|uniref:Glycosyltransferase 2-like domain-containing protein n=1 Tax=hydrothermal vent metagenome TaxID=652676 RepID=A0A3B1DEU2_9ZZZZ
MLNIIIPVLNEESILTENFFYFNQLKLYANFIFIDGGSIDKTVDIATQYGKVIVSQPGRGVQKNAGVKESSGNQILFMHVDTSITAQTITTIENLLNNHKTAGCLQMKINDSQYIFKIFAAIVNFRAKHLGVIDGDLGLFIHKDLFYELGQFPQLPYMEDIVFSKNLRKFTKIKILPTPIIVSSRKWYTQGFCTTFFRYMLAYIQLWTGKLKC